MDDILTLGTAARYQFPQNPADKLPIVLGDFISGLTRDPLEEGGCLKTVLINKNDRVYLLSDCAIPFEPIEVYARQNTPFGTIVNPVLYSFNPAVNYEGTGHVIAMIQFLPSSPDPTVYEITWRGKGAISASGQLINDAVTAIVLLFTTRGNWLSQDFDASTVTRAQGIAAAYGIPLSWVIQEDQAYGQILTELFENYLPDILLTHEGKLAINYNLWPIVPLNANDVVQPYLRATVDVLGDDPEDAISYELDRENLINAVVIRWRHNWAWGRDANEFEYTHRPSQSAYVARRPKEFTLRGIRTFAHLYTWIKLFLSPLVEYPGMVKIPLKSLDYTHMQRGSFVALDWSAGPDVLNQGWSKRVLRVLSTETNYLEQTHTLRAFDTRVSVVPPQAVPFRAQNNSLWYLRVRSLDGLPEFVSSLEFPWVTSGAERHWVERPSSTGQLIYVFPSATGVVTSSTTQPGVGTGDAGIVDLVDWNFRRWDIQVGPASLYTVTTRLRYSGVEAIQVP